MLHVTKELKEQQRARLKMPSSVWRSVDVLERAGQTDAVDPGIHEELTHQVAQVCLLGRCVYARDTSILFFFFF